MKTISIFLLAVFMAGVVKSQNIDSKLPEVGKPMPDFSFNDVHYFPKKRLNLTDFKGQWLILDCWNRYCGVCLRAMPKVDSLQREFKGKVQFLMVGYTGSQYTKRPDDKAIRKLFDYNRKIGHLDLPIAYDSVFFHRFDIRPTPYIIVVDPKGIVRGITIYLTAENINDLMANRQVELPIAYRGTVRRKLNAEERAKKTVN
jgi:thiol-disulfide isomerase/thioredoxin